MKRAAIYRGHVPFVRFLLASIVGIGLATVLEPHPGLHTVLEVGALLAGSAGLTMAMAVRGRSAGVLPGLLFLLSLLLVSWVQTWQPHPRIDERHFSRYEPDFLIGHFVEQPQDRGRHIRGLVRVTAGLDRGHTARPLRGFVQVTIQKDTNQTSPSAATAFAYGSRIVLPAASRPVAPPGNPGEMDYAAHLARHNCWHQLYIRQQQIKILDGTAGNPVKAYALKLRDEMVAKFGRYIPDENAYAIASTLILGYRADLSRELLDVYSATGTIHVLSVSGMHVVIVFWLLARLLFWMDLHPRLKRGRFPVLLGAIWGYALLTGFSPSVLRAAMMLSFVLWAQATDRIPRTYNSIGASAFFLLLYEPKLLLHIGFQLSYLAVLGIVFLYPFLRIRYRRGWSWLKPVGDYSAMSVGAQAGAFPLAMYYFQQFPVYFLVANLVIVLPATVIMYLGFALLLLPETTAMNGLLMGAGALLSGLIVGMNTVLAWIRELPGARLTGLDTTLWQCGLIYLLLLLLTGALVQRSGRYFAGALVLLAVLTGAGMLGSWEKWVQRRIVIHQLRSSLGISITGRGETLLLTNLPDLQDNALQFSVMPYLRTFAPETSIHLVPIGEAYEREQLHIEGGLIQVGAQRLYIYDGGHRPVRPLPVDVLLIRGNPRQSLAEIMDHFPCRKIVLDGSNYPATIARLEAEIARHDVESYVLKDNFAYVWVLDRD